MTEVLPLCSDNPSRFPTPEHRRQRYLCNYCGPAELSANPVLYRADFELDRSPDWRAPSPCPGGGNFGDLYHRISIPLALLERFRTVRYPSSAITAVVDSSNRGTAQVIAPMPTSLMVRKNPPESPDPLQCSHARADMASDGPIPPAIIPRIEVFRCDTTRFPLAERAPSKPARPTPRDWPMTTARSG